MSESLNTEQANWASMAAPGGSEGSPADYVQELTRKVENYYNFYGATGLFERDKRAYMTLYGLSPDGPGVSYKALTAGRNAQLTVLKVNQWSNLIQHQASLITARRPGLDVRATNADTASLEQSKLGSDVLEHEIQFLGLEATTREMTKMSLALREAWLWTRWNANGGEAYIPDDSGQPVKTGCLETSIHFGQDVIRDITSLGNKPMSWMIIRDFANRYDLEARFPEFSEQIMSQQRQSVDAYRVEFQSWLTDTDFLPVYQFYHAPTDALPDGRQTTFLLGAENPLLDGPLAYGGKIPVLDMSPTKILGTPFGYSPMHDLLGLQQIYDALCSGVVTNELAFAVRRLLVPRGQPISATQLSQDLGVIYYDPALDKPSMLETPLSTSERFQAIQEIERLMQTLSGINNVIRGNGEDAGTNAASGLALLQNQALQFLSGLEFEYGNLWRRWGELTLSILRERATAPQMIAIAGRHEQAALKSFMGQDLANSYRVTVDLGDPMTRTSAGRQALADAMLQGGLLGEGAEGASNYFEVRETGTLKRVMDEATAEHDLIERENEALMRGEVPPVSEFDTPALHYAKNSMVAFSHEAREQAEAEQRAGVDPFTGQAKQPSPILSALRQHMLLHRMAEQRMASTQNAQAGTLATMQMTQAPAQPGQPMDQAQASEAQQASASETTPGIQQAKQPSPPPNAMPLPGVQ